MCVDTISPPQRKPPLFVEGGQIAKGDQGGEDIEAPPVCAKRRQPPLPRRGLWADRVVRPYKVQWGLGKEGGEVGLGRGGRCDGIVLGEEVQDVRREERRERRPEADTLDAEVQEREQDADGLLLVPAEDH